VTLIARILGAAFGLALIATGTRVNAQTVTQTLSSSIGGNTSISTGLDGWTVQINGCTEKQEGASAGACYTSSTLGTEVVATATAGSLSLVFQTVPGQTSPNTDLLYSGYSDGISDLNFTLMITAPGTGNIWYASDALAGSVTLNDTTGKQDVTTSLASYAALNASLAATPGVTGTTVSNSFSGIQDTKVNPTTAPSGDTSMVITSLTDTFKAPEPISLSLFAVGLVGLGVARRRRAMR
jgi:hypothetical protein